MNIDAQTWTIIFAAINAVIAVTAVVAAISGTADRSAAHSVDRAEAS